jgi:predicted metal-dependent hydrolase
MIDSPASDIPPAFWDGIDQFNQGEFYACHDTLEAIWMESAQTEKAFYQGVLQIAVALYHLGNLNWQGAVILLGEGIRRLTPYEPHYFGIDVERLVDDSVALLRSLQALGAEKIEAIAQALTLNDSVTLPSETLPTHLKCPVIVRVPDE